jgi:hypothetical protein
VIYQNHKANSLLEKREREIDLVTYNFNPPAPFAKGDCKDYYI